MTGGELVAAAKERMEPYWSVTRSQVYRELRGLAEAGYVRPGKLGPRAAQPYAITAAGKRAFRAWLTEAPGADHSRNPLVLRIGFGAHHAPGAVKRLVEDAAGGVVVQRAEPPPPQGPAGRGVLGGGARGRPRRAQGAVRHPRQH